RARRIFQDEFYLDPDARVLSTQRVDDEVEVRYVALDNTERTERFDYALVATGRRPNVDRLDLHLTSLALDGRGVPVFDRTTMQAGESAIFIAGDANADAPLLHEAADEGRIAGMNAARYPDVRPGQRRAPLGVVFSDPQIALVGASYGSLPAGSFVTGEVDFGDQGRSRVMLKNKGMLHVYADIESGRFLGAEMVGPSAEHIGHLLAWAAQQQLTVAQMLDMPFYHPVVEDGVRTALRDAAARLAQARRHPRAAARARPGGRCMEAMQAPACRCLTSLRRPAHGNGVAVGCQTPMFWRRGAVGAALWRCLTPPEAACPWKRCRRGVSDTHVLGQGGGRRRAMEVSDTPCGGLPVETVSPWGVRHPLSAAEARQAAATSSCQTPVARPACQAARCWTWSPARASSTARSNCIWVRGRSRAEPVMMNTSSTRSPRVMILAMPTLTPCSANTRVR